MSMKSYLSITEEALGVGWTKKVDLGAAMVKWLKLRPLSSEL